MISRDIRRARPEDLPAIIEILWRGDREGAALRYDAAQRAARLPDRPAPEAFDDRLSDQTVWVSEGAGRLTGFVSLRADGCLDLAFVLPDRRGTGTEAAPLAMLENHAAARGLRQLRARDSDMARPFLARLCWSVVGLSPRTHDGIVIPATDMALRPPAGPVHAR